LQIAFLLELLSAKGKALVDRIAAARAARLESVLDEAIGVLGKTEARNR
jgi:hypothetical protein